MVLLRMLHAIRTHHVGLLNILYVKSHSIDPNGRPSFRTVLSAKNKNIFLLTGRTTQKVCTNFQTRFLFKI